MFIAQPNQVKLPIVGLSTVLISLGLIIIGVGVAGPA